MYAARPFMTTRNWPETRLDLPRAASSAENADISFGTPPPEDELEEAETLTMSADGLKLIRPIPRRPFGPRLAATMNAAAAAAAAATASSPTTPPRDESAPGTPNIHAEDLFFLDPRHNAAAANAESISRAASLLNLTSSTLLGIYSSSAAGDDRYFDDRDNEPSTPWGTGAETPLRHHNVDDETYELMRERAAPSRRRSSATVVAAPLDATTASSSSSSSSSLPLSAPPSLASSVASITLRAALLFVLGALYGVLVTALPGKQDLASFGADDLPETGVKWGFLALWGVAGVALGSLLPWFDGVWERTFRRRDRRTATAAVTTAPVTAATTPPLPPPAAAATKVEPAKAEAEAEAAAERPTPGMDWALVMRGVGAFVGIAFAIRRLPWTSATQVSATLALANPILWYLIDRSKPGFLLSTVVALAGSAALVSFNPDAMPVPAGLASGGGGGGGGGGSGSHAWLLANGSFGNRYQHHGRQQGWGPAAAGQDTLETAMWTLSVLFCSCVCFGNIGRRLALSQSAAARGRWGGVR